MLEVRGHPIHAAFVRADLLLAFEAATAGLA